MANSWAASFGFTYDALSRRTQMTRPNNVATNYTYDNLSHLLSVLHQLSGGTIDGAVYTLDPAGNRTAKTDEHAGVTSNYGYDAIYELLQTTQGTNTTESYTYDPVGNRLSSLGVSSYTNNSSNELTSTSSTSYAYDYNGNETSETNSSGTTNFSWDYENRMTQVTLPGTGGTVSFKYDSFGRRVQKAFTQNSTTTTTNYVYDGADTVEETDQNGNELAKYARTMNIDEPLAESRSGVTSYYQQDGLGSVTSLSSTAGALANTYTYDSFGNTTNSTGTLTNPFRYTGREFDTETSLFYYRARYYDPTTGRFLSEDPAGFIAGIDLYAYVGNRSTNYIDPMGLQGGPWHPPAGVHTKCQPTDDCSTIKGKIWVLQRMIASHAGWDQAMPGPRGGNRHAGEIAQLWTQLAECQDMYSQKCKDCDKKPSDWKPVPIPIVGPILDALTDPILDALQGVWNDIKNWNPPPRPIWGPAPVPVPMPTPVVP